MQQSTEIAPDFLTIGHVTKDLLAGGGFVMGGTVTYASLTARNLGRRVGIVTSAASDLDWSAFDGIRVAARPSAATTCFQNIYNNGSRQQFIKAIAEPLRVQDIPPAWAKAPIVLLGPLARELDIEMARAFPDSLLGITAQGWMREWDAEGRVSTRFWAEADKILPLVDVLVFSYEDVGRDISLVRQYASLAPLTVVTLGPCGCVVYTARGARWLPAFEAPQVDPTGAGDVFAAAYLVALEETGDPFAAARFANCTASFSIEGQATSTIPTREQVEERLRNGSFIPVDCSKEDLIANAVCEISSGTA